MSQATHTASEMMVHFILLSPILEHLANSVMNRTFTAGTAPSLSTTSPSRAIDWSYFTISDGQVFLVVANYYAASGAQYNVKSAVYKMANNKLSLYQQLSITERYTYMLSRTKELIIWRLLTILMVKALYSTVQCTYGNEL